MITLCLDADLRYAKDERLFSEEIVDLKKYPVFIVTRIVHAVKHDLPLLLNEMPNMKTFHAFYNCIQDMKLTRFDLKWVSDINNFARWMSGCELHIFCNLTLTNQCKSNPEFRLLFPWCPHEKFADADDHKNVTIESHCYKFFYECLYTLKGIKTRPESTGNKHFSFTFLKKDYNRLDKVERLASEVMERMSQLICIDPEVPLIVHWHNSKA